MTLTRQSSFGTVLRFERASEPIFGTHNFSLPVIDLRCTMVICVIGHISYSSQHGITCVAVFLCPKLFLSGLMCASELIASS